MNRENKVPPTILKAIQKEVRNSDWLVRENDLYAAEFILIKGARIAIETLILNGVIGIHSDSEDTASQIESRIKKIPDAVNVVTMPENLNENSKRLVIDFAAALAQKMLKSQEKYGYQSEWLSDDWEEECRQHMMQHIQKGDPKDVAIYCAFLWYHNWSTTPPPPNTPSDEK